LSPPRPPTNEDTYGPRGVLLALALLLILVAGGLFLFYALRSSSNLQDCVMQGRTNCAPIESPSPSSAAD
jgi:hypothetical protein